MSLLFKTLLFSMVFGSLITGSFAQEKMLSRAKITFIAKDDDTAKTYLGRLTKGDLNRLRGELQRFNSGATNEVDVNTQKKNKEGYVNSIVIGGKAKSKKRLNKAAQDDLLGNYEVKNKRSLKEANEKKQRAAKAKTINRDESGNYKKYDTAQNRKGTPQLSKYFKISTVRKLRNGHSFSKPAGSATLIITYKLREGRTINTYVNVVDEYLNPGSMYNLKYHGAGSKRKYYLEFVPK